MRAQSARRQHHPEGSEAVGPDIIAPHLFTPETRGSSHYWTAVCMPKSMGPHGQALADRLALTFKAVFEREDTPMLELQQATIGDADCWGLKPVLLPSDAPGIRMRRTLYQLIAGERAAAVG